MTSCTTKSKNKMNASKAQFNGQINVKSLLEAEALAKPLLISRNTRTSPERELAVSLSETTFFSTTFTTRSSSTFSPNTVIPRLLYYTPTWRISPPSTMSLCLAQVCRPRIRLVAVKRANHGCEGLTECVLSGWVFSSSAIRKQELTK